MIWNVIQKWYYERCIFRGKNLIVCNIEKHV